MGGKEKNDITGAMRVRLEEPAGELESEIVSQKNTFMRPCNKYMNTKRTHLIGRLALKRVQIFHVKISLRVPAHSDSGTKRVEGSRVGSTIERKYELLRTEFARILEQSNSHRLTLDLCRLVLVETE